MGGALARLTSNIHWSEASHETRALESIGVTDIEVAFRSAIERATGAEDTAISAVFRSRQLISDLVASLSMEQVVGRTVDDEMPPLLENPNPREDYTVTMAQIVDSMIFRGAAYLLPWTRDQIGNITSCLVADPDEVTCQWDSKRIYPIYHWRGQRMEVDTEIVPIPLNRFPGRPDGVGIIEQARLSFDGVQAQEDMARHLFEDDATPQGALTTPEKLQPGEAKRVLDDWLETHQGRKFPGVMGGGATWMPIGMSSIDAQFIEHREFSVKDVGRWFGLPAWLLNADMGTSLTYSTTEGMLRHLVSVTINPSYLEKIAGAFSRMLPTGRRARFRTGELFTADEEARFRSNAIAVGSGFMTINEVREREGLPPIAGGDELRPSAAGAEVALRESYVMAELEQRRRLQDA
jgi:HK97 family phage portal protein